MSFGGGFGGTGFGSNTNTNTAQQNTGFGGFGASSNTGGFGQQTSGFGTTNNNATPGSIFGAGGSTFGASNSTSGLFGAAASRPSGFGSSNTTSGGLFGGAPAATTTTAGFGGFGASQPAAGFGAANNNAGTGLFGAAKPAFGSGNTSTGGIFGGNASTTGFGATSTPATSAFGAPQSTALGAPVADCQGTGSTPFQAFTSKDPPGASVTDHYQSITFMQPYQKYSFEELRLADYNQGRRFGNNNGQAGAFGTSTGFGGFGQPAQNASTGFGANGTTGLFGAQPAATSSPFGAATPATGGFASGGLFGAKPAGGLFGAVPATTAPAAGGMFGSTGTSGFGAPSTTGFGNAAGSTMFGTNGQAPEQKSGFQFGTSNAGMTAAAFGTAGGFGTGAATGTGNGLFGATSQGNSLFGAQPSAAPATTPFGQAASAPSAFGSAFGGAQPPSKPNLFGNAAATPTVGGLFGNAGQSQNATAGAFGAGNTGNALFGAKPAAAGTSSLFGNANATTGTGTGLFGNAPTQQTGGLFGQNQQQEPKPGGLFGNAAGSSLFGTANPNATGGGFGGHASANQPQQGSSLFGNAAGSGLPGNSQPNALQPPQGMTASLFSGSPYGSQSIFSGLPPPPQTNAGPIATPISSGLKTKKVAPLPQYKLNPTAAARLMTPQKQGYGFTYSAYGTPSSVSSTPGGLGSSLLGSSIGRNLGKSLSTSNLRRTFDNDRESILAPGAFSANSSSRFGGNGSMKRLTIDRSLRTDLFGSPAPPALPTAEKADSMRPMSMLRKKVSFDTNGNPQETPQESSTDDRTNGHRAEEATPTPSAQEQGFLRSSRTATKPPAATSGASSAPSNPPEPETVKGNELAIVHEDGSPQAHTANSVTLHSQDQSDPEPGEYFMEPPIDALKKMSREELKKVSGFVLGRENCGHCEFNEPVDLSKVDLDAIFDHICVITLRSLTIYPESTKKPPVGMGLNVPSTITLANSWPRQRDRKTPSYEKQGVKFNKHVDRLKKVGGTEFVSYNKDTGEWVFKVPHFTTYGFEYDEDEGASEAATLQSSMLSVPPDSPTPSSRKPHRTSTPARGMGDQSFSDFTTDSSLLESDADDTFAFRKQRVLPGTFDAAPVLDDDQEMTDAHGPSFLGSRSVLSMSADGNDEPSNPNDDDSGMDPDDSDMAAADETAMAGAFPQPHEDDEMRLEADSMDDDCAPGMGTPRRHMAAMGDDWAEQLQRTMSPRKPNRDLLRQSQALIFKDFEGQQGTIPALRPPAPAGRGIKTSIDIMNSLFDHEEARRSIASAPHATQRGLDWPYPKSAGYDDAQMPSMDRAFHGSFKPSWSTNDAMFYVLKNGPGGEVASNPTTLDALLRSRQLEIFHLRAAEQVIPRVASTSLAHLAQMKPDAFARQRAGSTITLDHGVPFAQVTSTSFAKQAEQTARNSIEGHIFALCSILFDQGTHASQDHDSPHRLARRRKAQLSELWSSLTRQSGLDAVSTSSTAEERAFAYLSINDVDRACNALVDGKNFRLATLVAQIGGDRTTHEVMAAQIEAWRKLNVLSEMTEPIRAIYELLAGHACICHGKSGPVEDQASTFVISERFRLDWKRSFGLRLWYAIATDDPLERAVEMFHADLHGQETVRPVPPFVGMASQPKGMYAALTSHEDPLWGILKLFSALTGGSKRSTLSDVVMPQNLHGSPFEHRLSFELYHGLIHRLPAHAETTTGDQITWNLASELRAAGSWLWATFILLHLSDHERRQQAIQLVLAKHADRMDDGDAATMRVLCDEFHIPRSWVWNAKALYARSVLRDHVREVDYLLRAEDWEEAHHTLCRVVAPQAIIEQNYHTLQSLLHGFAGKNNVSSWAQGGQIYEDYLLIVMGSKGTTTAEAVRRLLKSLPAMMHDRKGKLSFTESVAVQDMSGVVSKTAMDSADLSTERPRILRLPLADHAHLKHTMDLSLQYYRKLMAAGR